jgi:hypothetical protein
MKSIQLPNDQSGQRVPFEAALALLGVYPIPSVKIRAYEQEQLDAAYTPTLLGRVLDRLGIPASIAFKAIQAIPWLLFPIAVLSGVIVILASLALAVAIFFQNGTLGAEATVSGTVAAGIVFSTIWLLYGSVVYPARWHTVSWQEHQSERIPQEAIRLHVSLETLFPEASFQVRELRQGMLLIDPILFIVDPETDIGYPILIWDQDGNIVFL